MKKLFSEMRCDDTELFVSKFGYKLVSRNDNFSILAKIFKRKDMIFVKILHLRKHSKPTVITLESAEIDFIKEYKDNLIK